MKTLIITFCFLALAVQVTPSQAIEVPHEIGGFKLGEYITDYQSIEYPDYLKEVAVNDWYGFRKGIISHGTCAYPGQILKIRMKYQDSTQEFYQILLDKYRDRYGKPTEFKGDAFGVLYIWKWRFVDDKNRRVNLILQHNLLNDDENVGNMVKLSYPELVEEERWCVIKFFEKNKTAEEKKEIKQRKEPDWNYMMPR